MEFGAFKPLITALLMPLAMFPLLGLLGLTMVASRKPIGWLLCFGALVSLWLLSCQGVAVWLAKTALPQYPPATVLQLKTSQIQAIVILGGGIYPEAPEYGAAQPSRFTTERLRYGIHLARQSGLPVAFTGGVGWAAGTAQGTAAGTAQGTAAGIAADIAAGTAAGTAAGMTEAQTVERAAKDDFGFTLRWVENQSRDTHENATLTAQLLKRDGIDRVAVVTDALHMPRAMLEFGRTGLTTLAAPTGYILPTKSPILQWLPSAEGITDSTRLLHELLGLQVARLR